jgi:hypothetical protein
MAFGSAPMGYPRAPMPYADMPFNVTMYTAKDELDYVMVRGMDQLVVKAAFIDACRRFPDRTIRLRMGVRVIEERLVGQIGNAT